MPRRTTSLPIGCLIWMPTAVKSDAIKLHEVDRVCVDINARAP
jgi:hypothetical protein